MANALRILKIFSPLAFLKIFMIMAKEIMRAISKGYNVDPLRKYDKFETSKKFKEKSIPINPFSGGMKFPPPIHKNIKNK